MIMRNHKFLLYINKHKSAFINGFLSITAIVISFFAYNEMNKTNDISKKTLLESQRQFLAVNKPIIMVKQLKLGEGKDYFDLLPYKADTIKAVTFISLENIGTIIAGNVFIHTIWTILRYDGKNLSNNDKKTKPINDFDNLSDICIPPNQSVNRTIVTLFYVPAIYKYKIYDKTRFSIMLNILIYYYPSTLQIPNKEAEKIMYATNITNVILYNRFETSDLFFLDKPTLGMAQN
jgi:hypothetical protein